MTIRTFRVTSIRARPVLLAIRTEEIDCYLLLLLITIIRIIIQGELVVFF